MVFTPDEQLGARAPRLMMYGHRRGGLNDFYDMIPLDLLSMSCGQYEHKYHNLKITPSIGTLPKSTLHTNALKMISG